MISVDFEFKRAHAFSKLNIFHLVFIEKWVPVMAILTMWYRKKKLSGIRFSRFAVGLAACVLIYILEKIFKSCKYSTKDLFSDSLESKLLKQCPTPRTL